MSTKKKIAPIYIKSLEIENIRCFGSRQVLNLMRPDGTLSQWTLLLGNNGVGKTTLLQCIAGMRSTPYEKTPDNIITKPALTEEENDIFLSLIRFSGSSKEVDSQLKATFSKNQTLGKIGKSSSNDIQTSIKFTGTRKALQDIDDKDNPNEFFGEPIVIAYSASRKLGKINLDKPGLLDSIALLFSESTELYDSEEILKEIDYSTLKGEGNKKFGKLLNNMKGMLMTILPDLKDITIGPRGIEVSNLYANNVPFHNISLGYKTTLSWTIDLAWRLHREYPNSKNPLAEPAIVLIDEIDLHLHPLWQRKIMDYLSKHFPKTQFISTSHSPFMVQASYDSNYAVLKEIGNEVIINNDPKAIEGWRIDQIATSELFDVPTGRGPIYETRYNERKKLLKKSKLNKTEKAKLKELDKEIADLPTGRTPEDIEASLFIQKAAEELRKKMKLKNDKDR